MKSLLQRIKDRQVYWYEAAIMFIGMMAIVAGLIIGFISTQY